MGFWVAWATAKPIRVKRSSLKLRAPEATTVSPLQRTIPTVSNRGRSVLSAKRPIGIRANAYKICNLFNYLLLDIE